MIAITIIIRYMPNKRLAAVPLLLALILSGCQTGLSRETAKDVIEQSSLIRPTDNLTVNGILHECY